MYHPPWLNQHVLQITHNDGDKAAVRAVEARPIAHVVFTNLVDDVKHAISSSSLAHLSPGLYTPGDVLPAVLEEPLWQGALANMPRQYFT